MDAEKTEQKPEEQKPEKTPAQWAAHWKRELDGARKELQTWHERAAKVVKRFLDERDEAQQFDTRWNLFSSNIQTQRAMLYGKPPRVDVSRRFADSQDDVARVAGEMQDRILNTDIEKDSDTYALALQYALDDRLLAGLGSVRVRYDAKFEAVGEELADGQAEPAEPIERKTYECVETDYVHWKDQLWSPARVFHEVRWWAFKANMSRDEMVARFGQEIGALIPVVRRQAEEKDDEKKRPDPWGRADVWEIWSKDHKQVFWFVDGYPEVLDVKDDPYGLEGFWPFPRPMVANATTSSFMPTPDFILAQDLYNEVDNVSKRIKQLEDAVSVRGVYDAENEGIRRLLTEAGKNDLIPVANWNALSEKGGLRGAVDWLPLEQIVNALTVLRDYRSELIDALYQITGMSDLMRGQAATSGASATEQSIKAKFGSVRMQALQDEFARFASDVQKLKAELISRLFDPETIVKASNIENTPDAHLAGQAVALIKDKFSSYRIEVKPENVSLTDFAALKQDRMEVIQAIGVFLTAMAPIAQLMGPQSMPFLLQLLQASVAGLRGASAYESVLDQAIAAAEQASKTAAANPQQAAPDPKLAQIQMKAQADMAKEERKAQLDIQKTQVEVAGEQAKQRAQTEENVREHALKLRINAALRPPEIVKPGGRFGGKP